MSDSTHDRWANLLSMSAPAFAGGAVPPYGFSTRVLAQVRAAKEDRALVERIGWRAFLAALALLVLTGGFAVGFHYVERSDFDPGVRSLVQLEHVPVS